MEQKLRLVRCQPKMFDPCFLDRPGRSRSADRYRPRLCSRRKTRWPRNPGQAARRGAYRRHSRRNAACVDQPVFVRPVAEPEEAGVVRYNAFYVHPEPVALHDAGNAAARTRSVHILVNAKLYVLILQNRNAGKSGLRRPVRVHQAIRCPLRRPAS